MNAELIGVRKSKVVVVRNVSKMLLRNRFVSFELVLPVGVRSCPFGVLVAGVARQGSDVLELSGCDLLRSPVEY